MDGEGHILFFLPRPTQLISQFDKDFPLDLNYFRKGNAGYLNVFGKARIINDPEELFEYELTPAEINRALNKDILVVVRILKADYFIGKSINTNSITEKLKRFLHWLSTWMEPNHRSYDFSKQQIPNYGF